MEPASTSALLLVALHVIKEGMEMLPNYEQRKINEFSELLAKYEDQLIMADDNPDRDDDFLLNARSKLRGYVEDYRAAKKGAPQEPKAI